MPSTFKPLVPKAPPVKAAQRVPRPLTDDEREFVMKRDGNQKKLQALATPKPERRREEAMVKSSVTHWTK